MKGGIRLSKSSLFSIVIANFVALASIFVMLGWVYKAQVLVQIIPGLVPMQFNTALCFFLCSLTIISINLKLEKIAFYMAIFLLIFVGITVSQYIFNINTGLDTFFIKPFITAKTSDPGRMAPNTGICFLLFSIFIILQNARVSVIKSNLFFLPLIFGLLGLVSLLGYVFVIEQAYAWGTLTHMAIHTSIGFVLLALASIFCFMSTHYFSETETIYTQQYSLIILVLFLSFFAWLLLKSASVKNLKNDTALHLAELTNRVDVRVNDKLKAIIRLFARYNEGSYKSTAALKEDVLFYFKHMGFLLFVQFNPKNRNPISMSSPQNTHINIQKKVESCLKVQPDAGSFKSKILVTVWGEGNTLCAFSKNSFAVVDFQSLIDYLTRHIAKNFTVNLSHKANYDIQDHELEHTYEFKKFWSEKQTIKVDGTALTFIIYPKKRYVAHYTGEVQYALILSTLVVCFFISRYMSSKRRLKLKEYEVKNLEATKYVILNKLSDGVFGIDSTLCIEYVNQSARKMFEIKFNNQDIVYINDIFYKNKENETVVKLIKESFGKQKTITLDKFNIKTKHGKDIPVSLQISPILVGGKVSDVILMVSDISSQLDYENKILTLANYDQLTEIPNRRILLKSLDASIARFLRIKTPFALFFIDINSFKEINDNYGHHAGDLVLKHIARKISAAVRKNDVFARLSGDEFCLISEDVDEDEKALQIKANLNNLFNEKIMIDGQEIKVSLSIGYVIYDGNMTSTELLIKADQAMYIEKSRYK